MHILVQINNELPAVSLIDPDDCKRFHVSIHGLSEPMVRRAFEDARIGRLGDRDNAWINIIALRQLAAGRVPADWPERFDAMLAYAERKGWLDDASQQIQGHCEWTE